MADLKAALAYPAEVRRRYIDEGFWTDDRPQDWLARWVETDPDKPVSLGGGPPMTCSGLQEKARRLATALLGLGLAKGDVVVLQLPNIPQLLVAFHGVQMMGGVPAMVHLPYRAGELAPMLDHVDAKAVVCFNALDGYDAAGTFLGLCDTVPALEHVIVAAGDAPDGTVALDTLLETDAREIADSPAAADPALILFTSGTSSSPKAVVHAYHTLCASARVSAEDMDIRDTDVVLCAPAFTHAFGLVCSLIYLYAGATAALMPAYTPPALADCIRDTGATVICVGPAHIAANMKAGLWTEDVTRNLRKVWTGGSVCPPELVDAFDALLPSGKVFQVWGMTEVLMPVCNRPDASGDERRHSLGQPPRGHDLRFVGEDGFGAGRGRGRRAPVARPLHAARLCRQSVGHGGRLHRRRLFPHRRSRAHEGRPRLHHRPRQGRDQPRRRQDQSRRHRGDHGGPPGGGAGRRDPGAGRGAGGTRLPGRRSDPGRIANH